MFDIEGIYAVAEKQCISADYLTLTITSNEEMAQEPDDYGFFCELETAKTMEYEYVEYYVIAKRTHYEVRRKFAHRPIINGEPRTNILDLECANPSIEDLFSNKKQYTPEQNRIKKHGLMSRIKNISRDIYYGFVICCTTASCFYFIMNLPDYSD